MDIKALTTFAELVRTGSIRAAAEALNVSAPSVSRQLDHLEHIFGAPLVARHPRGITLTAAGEVLAARALRIGRELASARQVIDDLKGLKRGTVLIHVNGAAAGAILAPVLAQFSADHPGIAIEVSVTSASAALEAAATGLTDLAVTLFSDPDPRVETLCRVPLDHAAIVAPAHPLAARPDIAAADLMAHRLALPDLSFGLRRAVETMLRHAGTGPAALAITTSSLELQKELARRGAAVLILPEMTVARDLAHGDLVARPLAPEARISTHLELGRSTARPQGFAARRLAEVLETALRAGAG